MNESLVLYTDGASRDNPGPSGIGCVLRDEAGRTVEEISVPIGHATNNVAEYSALIAGLAAALSHGATRLAAFTDSQLMAHQINGVYRVRDRNLKVFHTLVMTMLERFDSWRVRYVPRETNHEADRLAARAAVRNDGVGQARGEEPAFSPTPEN